MLHLPIADTYTSAWALLLLGFTVGVLGGFFGIGGAFMVTPALNIFGFPMAYAVGTDIAHIFGKSIVSTFKHAVLRHVCWIYGIVIGLTGMIGVSLGKQLIMYLERIGQVGPVVRLVYILLLVSIGSYMVWEYLRWSRNRDRQDAACHREETSRLAVFFQRLRLWPMIPSPLTGIRMSFWVLVALGVFTGWVSGFLGVGGGFVRVPMMVYLLGFPTVVAVGTDLFAIVISNSWGAYTYATAGRVELMAACVMLLGAAVGAQLGALATAFVQGMRIRLLFAVTVLLAAVGVILKQYNLSLAAGVLMLGSATALTAIVLALFISGYLARRRVLAAARAAMVPETAGESAGR